MFEDVVVRIRDRDAGGDALALARELLLVIGVHGDTPVDHLLERSTSQRPADEASTPLLVLATADPASAQGSE